MVTMKFKGNTGITWSGLELIGLLEDESSRVYLEKSRKHFGLHPFHLTNLTAALNEILSSNLYSYDTDLNGFLLAYKNPKLVTPLGEIFYDTCFIHVDIEADFYIFRPEIGSSLKGIVNKKGLDHIGILVHKAFNVSIPKLDQEENWIGNNLEIGQEVQFKITLLDFTSKLPFIRGILNPDDYLQGCRLTEKSFNARNNVENNNRSNKNNHTTKHKKGRKKLEEEDIEISGKGKKDKVRVKKMKEVDERKLASIKIETVQSEYGESNCIDDRLADSGELEDCKESKANSSSKVKKKSRSGSSRFHINDEEEFEKSLSEEKPKRLPVIESKGDVNKIKLTLQSKVKGESDGITEEDTFENKVKVKKSPKKRRNLDNDEYMDEIGSQKYVQNSKTTIKEDGEVALNIKVEKCNSVNETNSEEEFPNKKQLKKLVRRTKLKTMKNEGNLDSEETSDEYHKKCRKSNLENVRIKRERVTSSSEPT